MRFKTILQELHRRHVFKASGAYLVVAWLIVEVLDVLFDAFDWPNQLLQISIVLLFSFFPIWLLFSWFYDITKDGIVRTPKLNYDEEIVSTKSVNLNLVIIASLFLIVVLLIANTFRMKADHKSLVQTEATMEPDYKSSVAVLAFADMSQERDHEYFADGISEEIINKLAQYKELKIPGRTSSFSYKHQNVTHHTIAEELDVAYILEGSIRPSNDMARITVQLIDVADGSHIWSDTFDREIEDILYTQDEIAAIVADRLKVTILNEEPRLRKVDPEAYILYLQAQEALKCYDQENTLKADSLITRSLEIDESYAPSWAVQAQVIFAKTYHYFLTEKESGFDTGIKAATKAVELDSLNSQGFTWLSLFAWQNRQIDLSEHYLNKASAVAPNDPYILTLAGNFALKSNRLSEASKYYEKAVHLDPKNYVAFKRRGFLHWSLGNLKEAEEDILKSYELGLPDYLKNYEMSLLHRDKGMLDEALRLAENEKNPFLQLLLKCGIYHDLGRHREALEILEQIKKYPIDENSVIFIYSEAELNFEIACLYAYMDNTDDAFYYLDRSFEHVLIWPEWLFTMPEFNNLHGDHRWEHYVSRLGKEYNYDFLANSSGKE